MKNQLLFKFFSLPHKYYGKLFQQVYSVIVFFILFRVYDYIFPILIAVIFYVTSFFRTSWLFELIVEVAWEMTVSFDLTKEVHPFTASN